METNEDLEQPSDINADTSHNTENEIPPENPVPEIDLTELTTLLQTVVTNQEQIVQQQKHISDINVTYYSLFIGLILGYIGAKAILKPWR